MGLTKRKVEQLSSVPPLQTIQYITNTNTKRIEVLEEIVNNMLKEKGE